MALDNAPKLGGSYLDLKELTASGPQLVGFRVLEFHPQEQKLHNGAMLISVPVTADAVILSGSRTGELWPAQKFIGAITAALRGVKNPRLDPTKPIPFSEPVFPVGKELVVRVKIHNNGAVGDPASPAELAEANAIYAKLGAEKLWDREDLIALAASEREPVGAGVGAAPANGAAQPLGAPAESWKADSGRPAWG